MHDIPFNTSENYIGISSVVDVFHQTELFETVNNDAVVALSGLGGGSGFASTKSVRKSTGISIRRILSRDTEPIDLAVALCERLQQQTGGLLTEFAHILLCHSHTDPSACRQLAGLLESRLGLPAESVTAFNFGCAGYLKLLTEGCLALEGLASGSRVAILTVETPEFWHDASDRLFCGIVSAGATATVLEVGGGIPMTAVRSDDFEVPMDRRPNPDALFRRDDADVFDFRGQPRRGRVMRMNPEPVFLNGIELMLNNLRSALLSVDRQPGERIVVAPHQPSGKLLKALVAAAYNEFPDVEFLDNLEFYGNTISSSVPTLVSQLDEVLQRNKVAPLANGDHLILLAAGICMEEIANHMSAGHACVRWQNSVLNANAVQAISGIASLSGN